MSARHQRGLSLVELMVGITIGMIVVAAASLLAATQMTDNRRLLLEVQLQQDLRATADIVTRELRRAGAWGEVDGALAAVATQANPSSANPLTEVSPAADGVAATEVSYRSSRAQGTTGPYGFRLDRGVVQSQLDASGGWQALTDAATMTVTRFDITPQNADPVRIACPKLCTDGSTTCWPTVTVRGFVVEITGRSTHDAAVVRSVRSAVRLRNDRVQFNDPANPTQACPA